MRRREFIAGLGGAAAAWPGVAQAQQAAMPVFGVLHITSPDASYTGLDAFRKGLSEAGDAEGRKLRLKIRWTENRFERLPELAGDLVRRRVTVMVGLGGNRTALAAKAATAPIPVVFAAPQIRSRSAWLQASTSRAEISPGITGFTDELTAKRLALLHELVPRAAAIGYVTITLDPREAAVMRTAAVTLGLQLHDLTADTEIELEPAFGRFAQLRVGAVVLSDAGASRLALQPFSRGANALSPQQRAGCGV
jgi:putative ABC transport system substrate-binding protein